MKKSSVSFILATSLVTGSVTAAAKQGEIAQLCNNQQTPVCILVKAALAQNIDGFGFATSKERDAFLAAVGVPAKDAQKVTYSTSGGHFAVVLVSNWSAKTSDGGLFVAKP